ncbi:MAG: hypothetical protein Ct9H300mP21_09440 [Pseudomonadota bacterium]|nr:MAG: hypothetical protein Ct9H300mP21_09440 [Pseudomonadota bacterium]
MEFQLTSGFNRNSGRRPEAVACLCDLGAITSDGSVAPEELEYLERALAFFPLRQKLIT